MQVNFAKKLKLFVIPKRKDKKLENNQNPMENLLLVRQKNQKNFLKKDDRDQYNSVNKNYS